MMNKKILEMLNEQVTKELYSSILYLQMAAWCETQDLSGFANWMKIQSQEELDHLKIFYQFISDSGGMVEIGAIQKAPVDYSSPLDILEKSLAHEKIITAAIHNLMEVAMESKDYPTISFLDWFIREQVEEEATLCNLINNVKRIGNSGEGIFMFDNNLSQRTYTLPGPLAGKE